MHFQRLSDQAIIAKEHQPLEVAQLQRLELLLQVILLAHLEARDKAQLSLPNSRKRSEKKNKAVAAVGHELNRYSV